jgi:hypothetical protein
VLVQEIERGAERAAPTTCPYSPCSSLSEVRAASTEAVTWAHRWGAGPRVIALDGLATQGQVGQTSCSDGMLS